MVPVACNHTKPTTDRRLVEQLAEEEEELFQSA